MQPTPLDGEPVEDPLDWVFGNFQARVAFFDQMMAEGVSGNQVQEIVDTIRAGRLPQAAAALTESTRARMTMSPAESGAVGQDPSKPDDLSFVLFRPGTPRGTSSIGKR